MSGSVDNLELDLSDVTTQLRNSLEIKDRRYHLRSYPKCFLGTDAVNSLIQLGIASDAHDAIAIGNLLLSQGMFSHVTKDHEFKDQELFYRFTEDDPDHGKQQKVSLIPLLVFFFFCITRSLNSA